MRRGLFLFFVLHKGKKRGGGKVLSFDDHHKRDPEGGDGVEIAPCGSIGKVPDGVGGGVASTAASGLESVFGLDEGGCP